MDFLLRLSIRTSPLIWSNADSGQRLDYAIHVRIFTLNSFPSNGDSERGMT